MQEPSRSLASLSKESNPPQKRAAALGSYSSPDRATGLANGVIAVKQGSDTREIFHPKYQIPVPDSSETEGKVTQ